jgi:hypothetical protein
MFLAIGNQFGPDLIVGYGVAIGNPARYLPRPPVPTGLVVRAYDLAQFQLQMMKTTTPGGGGFTLAFVTPNILSQIFYTLDGSAPSFGPSVTNFLYTGPLFIGPPQFTAGATVTVKAQAFGGSGLAPSVVDTSVLTIP